MSRAPLYPHIPKRREPMFPHVPETPVTPEVTERRMSTIVPTGIEGEYRLDIGEQVRVSPPVSLERVREIIDDVPDIDDPGEINYWVTEGEKQVYVEGWCDKCLAGTGFPSMEKGGTFEKINYIVDLTPEILQRKAREKGLALVDGGFIELEDATNLYGVTWGVYSKVPVAIPKAEGELLPPQYRGLVGLISEPLLPAIEPEEGERKIDAVMRQLKNGVEGIQDSHQFRLFLTTMSKFHAYSIGNQILIMLQQPNATHVAGFVTWKELGRWVKRGGKSISILAPRFPPRPTCPKCGAKMPKGAGFCPKCGASVGEGEIEVAPAYFLVVSVFDISQTEGKPLPEFEVPVLTGVVNEQLVANLLALMKKQGVAVSFESNPHMGPDIKGQYSPVTGVWIRPEEPRAQQLKSLLHEVAHYYSEGVFRIPRRDAETIAESASFVVGAHYGFDTGVRSFPYVALWATDKKVLEQNLEAIRKVAVTMLEALSP